MNILFYVNSNKNNGSGHFKRSLLIANLLKKKNKIFFLLSNRNEEMQKEILKKKFILKKNFFSVGKNLLNFFKKISIEEKINLIIIDNYQTNYLFEKKISLIFGKVMVVDDRVRKNYCDYFLNYSNYTNIKRFCSKKNCNFLLGLKYSLIKKNIKYKKKILKNKIFMFFGTRDSNNFTTKILKVFLDKEFLKYKLTIVLGLNNLNKKKIFFLCKKKKNITIYNKEMNLNKLMFDSKFCIISGGTIMLESVSVGKFPLIINQNITQFKASKHLENLKLIKILKNKNDHQKTKREILSYLDEYKNINYLNNKYIDGKGAFRVYKILKKDLSI